MVWVPFFDPFKNEQHYRPYRLKDTEGAVGLRTDAPPEHQRISGWRELLTEQEASQ